MIHRRRRLLVLLCVPALALVAWVLLPGATSRGVIAGVLGALAVQFGALMIFARTLEARTRKGLPPPPLPVESWDYALEGLDLAGAPFSFSRFSGKVLVLNFWATWCGPCVAEMPSLQRLQAATSDLDVAFACVTREKSELVNRFLQKRGFTLPFLVLEGEPPTCFRSRGIPATFVLDKAGRIVMRHYGAARWDDPSVVAFVRGLAATPP
jgi:thiol-disulfide isomerase/thioredoxin